MTGLEWCCAVRFAWSCPVLFWPHRFPTARLLLCLKRTSKPPRQRRNDSPHAQAGGPGPVSLKGEGRSMRIDLAPACPRAHPVEFSFRIAPPRVQRTMRSTPQRNNSWTAFAAPFSGPFGALILRPGRPEIRADKPLLRALNPGGGVISSGALLGATGGTQTHSRRTGRKLGRLRYARQGLVRVPESNTKYGGQDGITGGSRAPVIGPSISESSGNPNRKICPPACGLALRPLFTAEDFFPPPPLPLRDSRNRTGVAKRHVGTGGGPGAGSRRNRAR